MTEPDWHVIRYADAGRSAMKVRRQRQRPAKRRAIAVTGKEGNREAILWLRAAKM